MCNPLGHLNLSETRGAFKNHPDMRPFPSQMLALTSLARPMLSTFFKVPFQHLQSSRQEQSKYGWGRGSSVTLKTESRLVPYSKNLSHNTLNKYNTVSPRGKDEKKEIFMILDLVTVLHMTPK